MPILKVKIGGSWKVVSGSGNSSTIITDKTLSKPDMAADAYKVGERLTALGQQLAALTYKPIEIQSMQIIPKVAEIGSTINQITLKWSLNKQPVSQWISFNNGAPIELESTIREKTWTGLTLNSDTSCVLTVYHKDEKGESTISEEKVLEFTHGIYYGTIEQDSTINSELVRQKLIDGKLLKLLTSERSFKFTATPTNNEVIFVAAPVEYGVPVLSIDGLVYELPRTEFQLRNTSDYTESYYAWCTSYAGLDTTTIFMNWGEE